MTRTCHHSDWRGTHGTSLPHPRRLRTIPSSRFTKEKMVESDSEELDWIRSQPREELVSDDPYDFANPSDNLFARLFVNNLNSPGACIPWKYCDLILSTFKDIRFNSRDVTFKSCGDMFCRMGRYRDDTWSMVEARSVMDKTFPQAVLEGCI